MSGIADPLLETLRSTGYVTGYTHGFYRYPARFPPEFARAVIREFTEPGDLVLDPFMGGGTAVIEAIAEGRRAVGIDLNPLAHFVTLVKTTPLSRADHHVLRSWAAMFPELTENAAEAVADRRTRSLPHDILTPLVPYVAAAARLRPSRRRRFARCVLLRVGQWALESRQALPTPAELRARVASDLEEMLAGLQALISAAAEHGITRSEIARRRRLVLTTSARGYWLQGTRNTGIPSLVLTSPPYPGVHVLYHRWQVLGRRETPAPFWLADLQDGRGESYYRFGSRTPTGLRNYFATLRRSFEMIRQVIGPQTLVAQLVAFADVELQLPIYLKEMEVAGYEAVTSVEEIRQGHLWRPVPHRRWYVRVQDAANDQHAANEVLLLHRLAR